MPTPAEKIAQIEAAFRQRFFPLVPKVEKADRIGWTEDQHDTDRLSRALAAYSLIGLTDVDDGTAAGAITDGKNDGGIDALHFDRAGNRLVFVQAKFKRTGAAPAQDDVLKTINGIKALVDRRFPEFNQAFQNRLDDIEEALDTAGIKLCVVLAYVGENLSQHVTNDLNALQAEMNRLSPRMTWESAGLTKIYDWLVAEQTPSTVDADVVLENWAAITGTQGGLWSDPGRGTCPTS